MGSIRFDSGDVGRVLRISGLDDIESLPGYLSEPFRRVVISPVRGESDEILKRLVPYAASIKEIFVADLLVKDLSVLMDFTDLVYLGLNTYCKTRLNFSSWPRLKECSIGWRRRVMGFYDHRVLQNATLSKWDGLIGDFSGMPNLERLELIRPRLASFSGAAPMPSLTNLAVHYASRLTALEGIEVLGALEKLLINSTKGFGSLDSLSDLDKLSGLWLDDDGGIATLMPLVGLKRLWAISLCGSTDVLDGKISVLENLPSLQWLGFTDRKHYDRVCTQTAHDFWQMRK